MRTNVFVCRCLLILTLAGLAAVSAPAQGPNRAAIEKQLLTAERAINEAIAKGDMKTFHSNLAPDALSVDPGGIAKVDTEFDKMLLQVKIQTWNIDNSQFHWVNDNTVIHLYRWTGKGTMQGQPLPSPVWSSTVWTNKGGKWIAAFHQETQTQGPPPPPAR